MLIGFFVTRWRFFQPGVSRPLKKIVFRSQRMVRVQTGRNPFLRPGQKESVLAVSDEVNFKAEMGRISRQSGVVFSGTIFTAATGYAFKIYLARFLGAEALGLYALGMMIIGFMGMINVLGLSESPVRFVPCTRLPNNSRS